MCRRRRREQVSGKGLENLNLIDLFFPCSLARSLICIAINFALHIAGSLYTHKKKKTFIRALEDSEYELNLNLFPARKKVGSEFRQLGFYISARRYFVLLLK